ncbi:metal-dependent hydrolase [Shewanella surugensis]|uniref:Metal-dependent hydrolase n=1 Tax=Shewanella surugensis TaxID=212020 RepID=A0ABT0LED8_9GAMM|nr:metal-dependent hydrolase [Shewanella surugensis]MCL1125850.1 metal-dependent hydrolase [Shewanella surugensis]
MANFSTHLKASIITSAPLSSIVLATHISTLSESLLLFFIGALSGLLPDLDSDNSTSIQWLFSILGFFLSGSVILLCPLSSLVEMWIVGITIYAFTLYAIKPIFEKLTVHRGTLHSILAVIMFAIIGIILSLLMQQSLNMSLLVGVAIIIGALTHLILDECYSVDLANNTLKSSFGTAMKLIDLRYPLTTFMQVLFVSAAIFYLYPYHTEINSVIILWQVQLDTLTIIPPFMSQWWR